tara:strand:+ start:19746 stop:20456 length:711 start_codon:yes stop_codon:yes gene_type:complete
MRLKEFLSIRGIEFESINIREDADGMAELQRLGARSIPVVSKGDRFTFAQVISDVVEFLELDEETGPELKPQELMDRMNLFMTSAQRFVRQMPQDNVEDMLPGRPRSYRMLMHHIFQIPRAFLDIFEEGEFKYENTVIMPPDDMTSPESIARFGEQIQVQVNEWWATHPDQDCEETVKTYYGQHKLHDVLERTTWHSGQHIRQLMSLLEQLGVTPDNPLTMEDYKGLPVPTNVWDG